MAGQNNFLDFNPNLTNAETDAQYTSDAQRTGGIATGSIITSELMNKAWHQFGVLCYALAQAMADKGYDMLDSDSGQLVTNLSGIQTAKDIVPELISVPYGVSVSFDASKAKGFQLLLTGNVASSSLVNTYTGEEITFLIQQDGTGGRTFAWPANVLNPGTVDAGANNTSMQKFKADLNGFLRPVTAMTVS